MHRLTYFRVTTRPIARRLFCTQSDGVALNKLTVAAVKETFEGKWFGHLALGASNRPL